MKTGRYCGSEEKGIALVMVAALLVVLIGMIALAVDIGVLYSARTSSQQVVDAAALGGAFTFISDPTAPQPATAIAHATEVAVNNGIMLTPVSADDLTVSVDIPNQRVTVDLDTTQPTFFARVLSIDSAQVGTRGIAEAGRGASVGKCAKPWFIPNTMVSTEEPCEACARSPHGGRLAPGQFYALDIGEQGGGANEYEEMISGCAPPVACEDILDVKTGNMVGPTRKGVADLIGEPARDTYIDVGQYRIDGENMSDLSDGLVIAPIWDTCSFPGFCPGEEFPSATKVSIGVVGFALVFLEGFQADSGGKGNGKGKGKGNGGGNQDNLVGRLINVGACSPASTGAGVTGSTVFSFPLRLVRVP